MFNLTLKRLYAVALVSAGLLILTACGFGSTGQPEVKSYAGTWSTADFVAEIDGTSITVMWTNDDSRSLYWVGTFDGNKKPKDGDTIKSTGDVSQMRDAMMASQDDAKNFTFKDDNLSFELTALGVQRDIHLVKQP